MTATVDQINELFDCNAFTGGDVRIVDPEHPRQVEIIVRPKYSSRTFRVYARVEEVREL